jgi:hypothetical protein
MNERAAGREESIWVGLYTARDAVVVVGEVAVGMPIKVEHVAIHNSPGPQVRLSAESKEAITRSG